jgi:hypothetical protein
MKRSRFTEEQIIGVLREHEAGGCCQTKSPQRLVVVASVHEQPVPLFQ